MKFRNIIQAAVLTTITIGLLLSMSISGAVPSAGNILILCSSYTGNTRVACESLQTGLGAKIMELKDLKNPPKNLKMEKDSKPKWVLKTEIAPKSADLSSSDCIILGSPVWMATLAPAMRTFIELNRFDGKKVILLTTTNASLNEEQKNKIKNLIAVRGGIVAGYYEILAQDKIKEKKVEKTKEQIKEEAVKLAPEISKVCSAGT